jgi:3,4-dihydroxy 2-butanone 4-phosphate synthase
MLGDVERALQALVRGDFVLLYDSDRRERETDLVIASEHVTHEAVRRLRRDGGGLICTTVAAPAWTRLGIPFLADLFHEARARHPLLAELVPDDIPYDTKSAFAITINHRKTFTGITDRDRALTISTFARMVREALEFRGPDDELRRAFGQQFRSPGHVALLNASDGLLSARSGHTEMATALVQAAGLIPSATICEMMGDDGRALAKEQASALGRANGFVFLEGAQVKEFWDSSGAGAAASARPKGPAGAVLDGR